MKKIKNSIPNVRIIRIRPERGCQKGPSQKNAENHKILKIHMEAVGALSNLPEDSGLGCLRRSETNTGLFADPARALQPPLRGWR